MSSNRENPPEAENDKKNSSSKKDSPSDDKKDGGSTSTGSNGGATTGGPSQPKSKHSSVGATVREEAQKLLDLAHTYREWAVVDQLLKSLEKTVQSAAGENGFIVPLAGVLDTTTGMTPLMYAVEDNRSELFDRMIELGSDVNARNNKGKIPLLLAVEAGNQSICRKLLAHQALDQLYAITPTGDSAVHLAARRKDIDMVQILVDYGAAVNMQNSDGQTALHIASAEGDKTLVKCLYDVRASASITDHQDRTPMHLAAENGHATIIELLVDKFKSNIFKRTKDGSTLMHIASLNGHSECITMLLKKGLYLHMPNKHGARSIHTAAGYGHVDIINTLLQRGEKVDAITNDNYTALHIAVESVKPAVVETLLGYGAKVNMRGGKLRETPLHIAAKVADGDECALMLLQSGANPNLPINDGQTPVHVAASHGNLATFLLLLDNDGDPMFKSKKGETPLHLACRSCRADVVRHLIEFVKERKGSEVATAYVNSQTNEGASALHYVALIESSEVETPRNDRAIIHVLLESGADVSLQTRQTQESAFHHCALAGNNEVLTEMISRMSATKGKIPLLLAVEAGNQSICRKLLAHQRAPDQLCATTPAGDSAVHLAARRKDIDMVRILVDYGAAVDMQNTARNKLTEATPLQLAAEGGHAEIVKALVKAGASCADENCTGFTAVHLAAQHGHCHILDVMRSSRSLRISSKKLGVTALHVAAYFGQANMVRKLLTHISRNVKSDSPIGGFLVRELGVESGMTSLHLAAYSGNEKVVQLLLNSTGVQVDVATKENGWNSLHLACFGGHITVVGLLLSRSAELLHSSDRYGKTGLHIAATHGHYQMVKVLLDQKAEINATDKNGWTPLHCAARTGHLDVVKLLVESGGSPETKTNLGCAPIWFAASEGHNDVLKYLIEKEHDKYAQMEDRRFVYNMMVCSKSHDNKLIEEFILMSPAPVDTAAKLSNIYMKLSEEETERAKDLITAGKQCEAMAIELLTLAAGIDSADKILMSVDHRNVEFLDILIENEQKDIIAHTVVQRYLKELWQGLNWNLFRTILLFIVFVVCPPVWMMFALPLGHKYNNVPVIKFMTYFTSHIYLMIFLLLVGITPINSVVRTSLIPYWYEWCLLVMLSGFLLFELMNPSDKSGLGWIKLAVLFFGIFGVAVHLSGLIIIFNKLGFKANIMDDIMEFMGWTIKLDFQIFIYLRNQLFALSFILACVQILDFLSFHHLFGPWAIIIGNLMKDLARFFVVLAIFIFGFSMQFIALNQRLYGQFDLYVVFKPGILVVPRKMSKEVFTDGSSRKFLHYVRVYTRHLTRHIVQRIVTDSMNLVRIIELLFFAIFGQSKYEEFKMDTKQPDWTIVLFKLIYGIYMLVSVVILINLLIATMSNTYQRIQAQSDTEWKYGLSKLICKINRTTMAPPPLNLLTTWIMYFIKLCKKHTTKKQQPLSLTHEMNGARLSPCTRMVYKDSVALSVAHLSPLGSQLSFHNAVRIENVVDWDVIRRKYRHLYGEKIEQKLVQESKETIENPLVV
ncbi:PREDICTED: LOW QUALITY PROTEIN: serine/threonine-protein phosphatase 6 regulatory ankyrin repeat subunit C-like [Wasmannia auropunctata]|uniref:LOW QUALITY PROTEIN: serine/threonine-protein phosphatase 6 regulatory ankyrin repeat subunit C-like n=1 Tax=Wasmannia auropunctata TaxID=64793 RepID=UPI0005F00517|nr:PREDICTED: LOW QUALITY PROTEIN: serine/threonine-protein phosphatase 6 regulatory ankyrin repeat subunit C-like [Wasmannia auropunctata]